MVEHLQCIYHHGNNGHSGKYLLQAGNSKEVLLLLMVVKTDHSNTLCIVQEILLIQPPLQLVNMRCPDLVQWTPSTIGTSQSVLIGTQWTPSNL